MTYLIRPAEICDLYKLARNLRDGDRLEVTSLGLSPAKALRASFRNAAFRYTAIIDGEIGAMWGLGCSASMLNFNVGHPWLMTARPVESVPVSFVKVGQRELAKMLQLRRRLEGHVAADYRMACRFLEVLGFSLGEPEEFGPLKAKFRKFVMER